MAEEVNIHVIKEKHGINKVFFLAIPAIIFVVVIGFFLSRKSTENTKTQAPTPTEASVSPSGTPSPFETSDKVVVIGSNTVKVVVAKATEDRRRGLAGVTFLPQGTGMFFDFGQKNVKPVFWMKGMSIAIDMIWINDSKIVSINKAVQAPKPGTPDDELPTYSPNQPVDYVLEVPAGFSEEKNIQVGDLVDVSQAL